MTQVPLQFLPLQNGRPAAEHPQARRQAGRVRRGQDRECDAIARASAGEFRRAALEPVAERVLADIAALPAGSVPDIERIQDVVEQRLIAANHLATARAYIVYREQHKQLRQDRKTVVDVETSINEYLERQDWRVNANANQGYSLGGLILNVSGKVVANYWLNHVYPPEVGARTARATSTFTTSTCWPATAPAGRCAPCCTKAERRARQGRGGAAQAHVERGRPDRQLPRHAAERMGRRAGVLLVRHLHGAVHPQGRHAYDAVKQCIQELIYNLNVPSRWGTQTPFTNLTFDWTCPEDLREQVPVIGGKEMPFTYGDCRARWT